MFSMLRETPRFSASGSSWPIASRARRSQTSIGTGSRSGSQGMYVEPAIVSRFSVPSSWAASIISRASSRPRARRGGVVVGQRVGPVQERAEAADRDADLLGHLADRPELVG